MVRRLTISRPHILLVVPSLLILAILHLSPLLSGAPAQSLEHRSKLHSVLSRASLSPPLRTPDVSLRFSPNGKYLLYQDPSGFIVLLRDPLTIILRISSGEAYTAQFSSDSNAVTIVGRALTFATWELTAGKKIASGTLSSQEECLDGALAPGGEFFACMKPAARVTLFAVATQQVIFEDRIIPRLGVPANFQSNGRMPSAFFFLLDTNLPIAGAFGLFGTNTPTISPYHRLSLSFINFSPDGAVLVINSPVGSLGLEIRAKKKFDLPPSLHAASFGGIALLSADRAFVMEKGKQMRSFVLSLKTGKVLASPVLTADRIGVATDVRYLILIHRDSAGSAAEAFDVDQNRSVESPPNVIMDILGNEIAAYNADGTISLYRVDDLGMLDSLQLPLSVPPILRVTSMSAKLDQLALAVDGAGAIFQVDTGERVASFFQFTAANFSQSAEVALLFPRSSDVSAQVRSWIAPSGLPSPLWDVAKDAWIHSTAPVFIEYSLQKESTLAGFGFQGKDLQIPYRLRALDPGNGKESWKRDFSDNPPTPFADPQGERLVLGWPAKSSGGKDAAARNPASRALYKAAKLTDNDSFFEVVDARTAKSIGGVLVQVGDGAKSFDSAFSVANTLILVKDGLRVSLYSLLDGKLKAHLVGIRPSASAQSGLLALEQGGGRLGVFDLNTGAKLDEQPLPSDIVYTHFSEDGKRLFVLTDRQSAITLDVSKVREQLDPQTVATQQEN